MSEMSQGYIYIGNTTNFQGRCNFISLKTGRIITRKKSTSPPMPQAVIKQVEDMVIKEDCDEDLIFTDRNGITLEVYDNDVNKNDVITGVNNNYNNYNSNGVAYEYITNDKE